MFLKGRCLIPPAMNRRVIRAVSLVDIYNLGIYSLIIAKYHEGSTVAFVEVVYRAMRG